MARRGVQGDGCDREVDEERGAPRNRVHQKPTDRRPDQSGSGRSSRPDPEGAALERSAEGCRDERQRARNQEGARDPLQDPQHHQRLQVGRQAAKPGRDAEACKTEHEHAAPPVGVGQRTGEDQERAQRQQVPGVDVRLALEHAEQWVGKLSADTRQGDVDDCGIEEDRG